MTPGGWIFMFFSNTFVVALLGYCFYRILMRPASTEHMHAPLEIDTRDREG